MRTIARPAKLRSLEFVPSKSSSTRKSGGAPYNRLLLTPNQRDRIEVVLVSPRNPLNIGAVARAMANFGFAHMTVAAPYAPNWREAKSAVGAPELLQKAKAAESLAEAAADCTFVIGTGTLTHRKPEQPLVRLTELGPVLQRELENCGRIALVLGPEKHGLTRDDLSFCHILVEIPTDPGQPSMNLGQAAAVCLYEMACRSGEAEPRASAGERGEEKARVGAAAPGALLDRLANLIEETMVAARYSPESMHNANRHDLRVLLRRLGPSPLDVRRMMGLFRRVLRGLGRTQK